MPALPAETLTRLAAADDSVLTSVAVDDPATWGPQETATFWKAITSGLRETDGVLDQPLAAAIDHALAAGHALPHEVGAWCLSNGHTDHLDTWRLAYRDRVPALATLATTSLPGRGQQPTTTALHVLVNAGESTRNRYESLLQRLLAEGAWADVPDGDGRPPLALAARLEDVRALVAAGADPLRSIDGVSVLAKAFGHDRRCDRVQWVAEWTELLASRARSLHRVPLAFALGGAGQREILDALCGAWGWAPSHLDTLKLDRAAAHGRTIHRWSWAGWLAFQSLAGLNSGVGDLLLESLARQGAAVGDLPAADRLWLNVVAHHQQKLQGKGPLHSPWPGQIPWQRGRLDGFALHPSAVGDTAEWALAAQELPLGEGGLTRYRPLRAWLVDEITQRLAARGEPQTEASIGAWRWADRLMLEEAQGEERQDRSLYRQLREAVLTHALTNCPAAPADPRTGSVWLAIASSLEQGSRGSKEAHLPSLDNGGGMHLPGDFSAWLALDLTQVQWNAGVEAEVQSLADRVRPEQIIAQYGLARGAKTWLGTWDIAGPSLRAARLSRVLPETPTPRCRVRM